MAFRFWRRIRIAPGVTLNLSKSGGSLSFGPRGAKFTIGPGGKRLTFGLPGTGLFYTTTFSGRRSGKGKRSTRSVCELPPLPPEKRLTLGFFKRLITPDDEEALVDGLRELVQGKEEKALEHLRKAVHLADGAYLAGFLALKRGLLDEAERYLKTAAEKQKQLGRYFSRYGISATMSLPITEEVTAHVGPNLRGVLLALVEVYQRKESWEEAISCLERLRRLEPDDVVVKLSLAELLLTVSPDEFEACRKILRLCKEVENETPLHTALLLYKGRALRKMGLLETAKETLTEALRRKKDRPEDLLRALRYERALVYEALGQHRRARAELEKIYAEDPDYADVGERLGV